MSKPGPKVKFSRKALVKIIRQNPQIRKKELCRVAGCSASTVDRRVGYKPSWKTLCS